MRPRATDMVEVIAEAGLTYIKEALQAAVGANKFSRLVRFDPSQIHRQGRGI